MIFAKQDLAEGAAKVGVEDGVDHWVEKTVDVAEPDDDADQRGRVVASLSAQRSQKLDDEEGQPAENERSGDDGESPRRLAFPALLYRLPRRPPGLARRWNVEMNAKGRGGRQQRSGEVRPAGPVMHRGGGRRQQAVGGLPRQTETAFRGAVAFHAAAVVIAAQRPRGNPVDRGGRRRRNHPA